MKLRIIRAVCIVAGVVLISDAQGLECTPTEAEAAEVEAILEQWLDGELTPEATQAAIDAILGEGCYTIPAPQEE